ncbi:hypothetical protein [Sphingomonas bacterium]|uniref:hypothetical protein n=1 Tax=Sphingomonas bacterium TaxID=1895847 RepID=UPI001575197F|nr:hypothetical protein [Sphingomonas bacterium]
MPQALIRMLAADYMYDGVWSAIDEDDRHCLLEWVLGQITEDEADYVGKVLQMRGFDIPEYDLETHESWDEYWSRRG